MCTNDNTPKQINASRQFTPTSSKHLILDGLCVQHSVREMAFDFVSRCDYNIEPELTIKSVDIDVMCQVWITSH